MTILAAILFFLSGAACGVLIAGIVFWNIVARVMDTADESALAEQYGPPTTPAQRRTQ